jgi:hypothetical protein
MKVQELLNITPAKISNLVRRFIPDKRLAKDVFQSASGFKITSAANWQEKKEFAFLAVSRSDNAIDKLLGFLRPLKKPLIKLGCLITPKKGFRILKNPENKIVGGYTYKITKKQKKSMFNIENLFLEESSKQTNYKKTKVILKDIKNTVEKSNSDIVWCTVEKNNEKIKKMYEKFGLKSKPMTKQLDFMYIKSEDFVKSLEKYV